MESHRIAELHRVLDQVRPYVEGDGGGLELVAVTAEGQVSIRLTGNCTGCGSVEQTVDGVIAPVLKSQLSWVSSVLTIEDGERELGAASTRPVSCTAALVGEHDRTSALLRDLEEVVLALRGGDQLPDAVDRWNRHANSALRRHFELEEACVFPAFEMLFGAGGPVASLLDDHRSFWPLQQALDSASIGYGQCPSIASLAKLMSASQGVIRHLTVHFLREEGGLFSLLEESLPDELAKELIGDISRFRQRTIVEFAA